LPTDFSYRGKWEKIYLRCGAAAAVFVACTPRLIMSCNSSGMDERANAVSSVMAFWK
jgi:hypothetical protein